MLVDSLLFSLLSLFVLQFKELIGLFNPASFLKHPFISSHGLIRIVVKVFKMKLLFSGLTLNLSHIIEVMSTLVFEVEVL